MHIHIENPISSLESQAKELGININALCDIAGIARSTITRGKNGAETKRSTINKLIDALSILSAGNAPEVLSKSPSSIKQSTKHPNLRTSK